MRTTIDIEDELLDQLQREAHRRRVPFKHLLNKILRAGLTSGGPAPNRRYRCPTFSMGSPAPPINLDKALALATALEDEEIGRELERRK